MIDGPNKYEVTETVETIEPGHPLYPLFVKTDSVAKANPGMVVCGFEANNGNQEIASGVEVLKKE